MGRAARQTGQTVVANVLCGRHLLRSDPQDDGQSSDDPDHGGVRGAANYLESGYFVRARPAVAAAGGLRAALARMGS